MARIPTELIQRIKSEVSCLRLAEGYGIALAKKGKDYLGLCPWHDDTDPSLSISPDKNLWRCLGACGVGGSVIDWEMKWHGISFHHACERLKEYLGLGGETVAQVLGKTHPPDPSLAVDADDGALLQRVVAFYHRSLKDSPEALAYLEQRGLANPELIDRFKLGFANRSLGYRLPSKQVKAGAELRGRLQDLGILRPSGHEHFNGSLVIPVIGAHGQVTELYGRKIGERLRKGTPLHLYLPGPHLGVFNGDALMGSKEIILCESLIDALTFWVAGYRNVTSAYGVRGFTDALMQAFVNHGIERVLIAYDRDEAGNRAAEALAKRLMSEGMACFRIQFPKGMDANAYARQVKPAAKSLGLAIRKAEWLGNGQAPKIDTTAKPIIETVVDVVAQITPAPQPFPSLAAKEKAAGSEIPQPRPEPPASPLPPAPPMAIEAQVSEGEIVMRLGDRRYRVRGLDKNTANNVLNINLLVSRGEALHVDSFNLYAMKHRHLFTRQASIELGVEEAVMRKDLGRLLLQLEALQQQAINDAIKPEGREIALSDEDRAAALALLKSPDLLDRIVTDLEVCGLVGETSNKLVGYLACTSRKLKSPLAVLIQSTSAAGKSTLMEALLELVPPEDRVQYSAMTGQSLYYLGEKDLKHKILAIAEEEGVRQAAYALKLLQSEGELTMASTGKDEVTGNLVTKEYRVEGPVMLFLTTTAIEIDEELMNRCVVLTVNESREQTQAIHRRQRARRTLDGLLTRHQADRLIETHQNAQRLLKPLQVVNPYAEQLTFLDDQTRTRRDHEKYLTLIESIALLHQHQREIKTIAHHGEAIQYIEATVDDIAWANRLAHEVLGRSLDALPPQTRRLLGMIGDMVDKRCQTQGITRADDRFSRRDIRESTRWGNTQLKTHLHRLEDLEYLLVHRGRRGQSYVYELLFDGDAASEGRHLVGLIEVEKLAYDEKKSAANTHSSGPSRPQVGLKSGGGRRDEQGRPPSHRAGSGTIESDAAKNGLINRKSNGASYRSHDPALAAQPLD